MKSIRKSMWGMYWKLHDKRKRLAASLKGYLDGLPPETRRRIVLGMFAAFAVLALYTFGKAVYDIGRNDGNRIVTDHAGQVELSVKPENNHNVIPYLYGTDEE
ncbi:DUF3989 domain-containing protein [Bacteroides uniformis]|nr:DUF3989 domain-containing protein [Bacteroides uniformis]